MKKSASALIGLILLVTGCTPDYSDPGEADILIANVNIVDIDAGEVHPQQDVFIKNRKILSIRPSAEREPVPENKSLVDGTGKYLVPGFWDNHVHFRGGENLIEENRNLLPLFIANGVTTVRDAGGDLTPAILDWIGQIEAGELTGPNILTSGPKLDGPGSTWAGSIELSSVAEVPAAIDSLEALGADYVKIYDSTISGDVFLSILDESEKRGLPVTGHMPYTVLYNETVERGLDATEHMYYVLKGSSSGEEQITEEIIQRRDSENPLGFWNALDSVLETYDPAVARNTYQHMSEHGTSAVPTLHIGGVLANLRHTDHSDDEYLNYIGPGIIKTYDGRLQGALKASEQATNRRLNLHQKFISMVPAMHREGVPILAGSDSGPFNTYVYPGISLHEELKALVDAGLSPAEALQTSAPNGAAFFGLEQSYGKTEAGFTADLVLLDENPLDNIENTRLIHTVIMNGNQVFHKEELNQMLEDLRKHYQPEL